MGFAQEMKDFLSASQSTMKALRDQTYYGALTEQSREATTKSREEREDPLNADLKKEKLLGMRSNRAAVDADTKARKLIEAGLASASSTTPPTAVARPPVDSTGAVDGPSYGPQRPAINTGLKESLYQARGGKVEKFAVGGMAGATDDDDEEEAPPLPQQVTPAVGAAPAADPTGWEVGARRRAAPPPPMDNGVIAGLKHLADQSGIGQEAILPALRQQALNRYARGAGAAPAVDMAQVWKKVDPGGTMPESVRNLNAINNVYDFYTAAGDQAKAKSAAAQMLQYYRTASAQYAAIAKAAANGGNMDAATKALMKYYANVPDGNDAKLWVNKDGKVGYTIKKMGADGTEKETHTGIMTPQEFGGALMKVGPENFDRHLITAAGEWRNDAQSQPMARGGTKPAVGGAEEADVPKAHEQTGIRTEITSHVDNWLADLKKNPKTASVAESFSHKERSALETTMYHMQRNNDMPPAQSFAAAKAFLTAPEPKKEGDPVPFRVTRAKGSDMATVQFAGDGQTIQIPVSQLRVMDKLRDDMIAEQEAKAKANKPSKYKEFSDAADEAALEIGKTGLRKAGDAAGAIGNVGANIGSVIAEPVKAGAASVADLATAAAGKVGQFGRDLGAGFEATHPGAAGVIKRGYGAISNPNVDPEEDRVP